MMASILDNILVNGALPVTVETDINTGANTKDTDIVKIPTDSLTLSGGNPVVFYTKGTTALTLPTCGTLSTRHDTLGVFAPTTSAELNSIITDNTGTGHLVFSKSPTLINPILGNAKVTTINGLAITNVQGSTLTFVNGATLTVTGNATIVGTNTGDDNGPSGDYVPTTRTINGHALSADIILTTADIGTTAGDIGLGNVDNTSDINKPVSTATQTAINNAVLNKVNNTTTVNGHALSSNVVISKADISLGNVDNTSDMDKPISTAVQHMFDILASRILYGV